MSKIFIEASDAELEKEYSAIFDRECSTWTGIPEYNYLFLKAQQQYCNDLLHARGHVFLNEVRDVLGLPRTMLGAVLGWIKGKDIDFGVDLTSTDDAIPLRFNPSGVVVHNLN